MHFSRDGAVWFMAVVPDGSNNAYLQGTTSTIVFQSAGAASTLPLDLSLWHRRLCHHHYAGVQRMVKEHLVTGLQLDSDVQPNPVCEPCLSGKMHAHPFPSTGSVTFKPLELVHSDLHGPLPVAIRTLPGTRSDGAYL